MKKYIGITIGPIASTMNFVSSPAALWASSYMFSCVCRRICQQLIFSYGIKYEDILSPYFDENDELLKRNDGIGLFHDRIIFEAGDFNVKDLNGIRDTVIQEISEAFEIRKDYLDEYVMITGAEYESNRPLLDSGLILDSLELSAPFVAREESNPIICSFNYSGRSEDESRSKKIKEIARQHLQIDENKWQLLSNGNIKSLGQIASSSNVNETYKINKYYAIIRADGDNMSKIISSLLSKEDYREFSKICLTYCAQVSDIVGAFDGFTVYAGGDDLLAVVPCENDLIKDGSHVSRTVFNLAKDISECFNKNFKKYVDAIRQANQATEAGKQKLIPSLSFGIFISYYKFPLYEALQESANLLFGDAKAPERKDCIAVRLQKHSGQSAHLILPNKCVDTFLKLQEIVVDNRNSVINKKDSDEEEFLLSAAQKVVLFKRLFNLAETDQQIDNVFTNTFDAKEQQKFEADLVAVKDFLKACKKANRQIEVTDDDNKLSSSNAAVLNTVLRVIKFYTEKKGADE